MTKSKKPAAPQFEIVPASKLQLNKTKISEQSEIDRLLNMNFQVKDTPNCGNPKFEKCVQISDGTFIYFGDSETKICNLSEIEKLQSLLTEKEIPFLMDILKIGEYSIQAKFNIRNQPSEIMKGDIINPCIIVTISGDMQHPNGIDIAGDRVICSNGLMRQEVQSGISEETLNLCLAKIASDSVRYRKLAESPVLWSSVQNVEIIETITKTGFQKKWIELAHQYLALEAEHANELNKWLVYNAFNKVIFEDTESSLNYHRKKQVDSKIFELVEAL